MADRRGRARRATAGLFFSPLLWLAIVQVCLVGALQAVGYFSSSTRPLDQWALNALSASSTDAAAVRAGLAFSGVTLGLTFGLALTSAVWAGSAFLGWQPSFVHAVGPSLYRWLILIAAVVLASVSAFALYAASADEPFHTWIGSEMLKRAYAQAPWADVPSVMFALAIVLPTVLAAGASFQLEEIPAGASRPAKVELRQRELDHLLYIGAVAMVFGTLQLSTTMSAALAGMPTLDGLTALADLCKAGKAADPALFAAATDATTHCSGLFEELDRIARADGLRLLVRNVTWAVGLSFSVMLVAVYLPAMGALAAMGRSCAAPGRRGRRRAATAAAGVGVVDPLHRLTTLVAALAPLLAGVVATAFGEG